MQRSLMENQADVSDRALRRARIPDEWKQELTDQHLLFANEGTAHIVRVVCHQYNVKPCAVRKKLGEYACDCRMLTRWIMHTAPNLIL